MEEHLLQRYNSILEEDRMSETLMLIAEALKLAEKFRDLDFKEKMRVIREQVLELQEENSKLKSRLKAKEEMKAFGPHNYFYKDEQRGGPYCPVCWQRDDKQVLLPASADYMTGHERYCQVCKTGFFEGRRKEQIEISRPRGFGQWS